MFPEVKSMSRRGCTIFRPKVKQVLGEDSPWSSRCKLVLEVLTQRCCNAAGVSLPESHDLHQIASPTPIALVVAIPDRAIGHDLWNVNGISFHVGDDFFALSKNVKG